ncbi:hypothetical protein GCM10023226_19600 [Nocardioides nanhaiensis]|uniref:Uncharacterized protein n=1 Tax=Nocardioides nanhaiensis TaxID=1476871 RepID=A0ABP8W767_9ACTN
MLAQLRQQGGGERHRCHQVGAQHVLEGVGLELLQPGEGARAQGAGVVDQRRRPAQRGGGGHERCAVAGVGHVAGDHSVRSVRQLAGGRLQGGGVPAVEDQVPPPSVERAGEGLAEPARGSGDDGDGHGALLRLRCAQPATSS